MTDNVLYGRNSCSIKLHVKVDNFQGFRLELDNQTSFFFFFFQLGLWFCVNYSGTATVMEEQLSAGKLP